MREEGSAKVESVEESGVVIQKVQTLGSEQVEREDREGGRSRSYYTCVHVHVQQGCIIYSWFNVQYVSVKSEKTSVWVESRKN